MILRSCWIALGLTLALAIPVAAQEQSLKAQLELLRSHYELPALAAAVARNGRILAAGATGTRVMGRDLPVTVDDRFHIGSDTKAMTATIAGMLVDEGKLRWDSTVGEVLGGELAALRPAFKSITLKQLLSHSSGIPTDNKEILDLYFSSDLYDFNLTEYRRRIIVFWSDKNEPAVPAGSPFQYSNLGYIVAAAMIEKAAEARWEELIHRRIFAPLGLRSAGLGPQATFGKIDAPVGHRVEDGKITPLLWGPAADGPAVVGPAGIVHMSVRDFARWGAWNAAEGRRAPALVKPETLKEIHRAHVRTPKIEKPPPGTPETGEYGFGWGIVAFDWSGGPVLTHNGSNGMNLATILVDPRRDLAIVVMTNISGENATAAVREALRTLYEQFAPRR